jgi:hypothetical protein
MMAWRLYYLVPLPPLKRAQSRLEADCKSAAISTPFTDFTKLAGNARRFSYIININPLLLGKRRDE